MSVIQVSCCRCPATIPIEQPEGILNGLTSGEVHDLFFGSILPRYGWACRIIGEKRGTICPACVAKEEQPAEALEEPSGEKPCPKCFACIPTRMYCNGLVGRCADLREHLHRVCGECGYEFKTEPERATVATTRVRRVEVEYA